MKRAYSLVVISVLGAIIFGCGGSSESSPSAGEEATTVAVYEFDKAYLQYRLFENSANNRSYSWLAISKDGVPVQESDMNGLIMLDSVGAEENASFTRFDTNAYMNYDCSVSPCEQAGQVTPNGYFSAYDSLAAGIYSIEVDTADGQTLIRNIPFPGELNLPVVASTTMLSQWVGGDLVLSWTNPTSDPGWSNVDQICVVIYDGTGSHKLFVHISPTEETMTIPAALVGQAAGLGDGTLESWRVQTREYDSNNMNCARGYSDPVSIN